MAPALPGGGPSASPTPEAPSHTGADAAEIRRDAGAVLCVGIPGLEAGATARAHILDRHIRTLILFRRNIDSGPQVARLTAALRALSPEDPPLIAVDQEGGAVARFKGVTTDFPAMALLGATGDRGLAHAFGTTLAEELTALGVELDFAPVVDVNSNPDNPVIGSRAFGEDAHQVAALAAAQIQGMAAGGLIACAKHFPGHGDTDVDSHRALPTLPHGMERLNAVELVPFKAAIAARVPAIMTAHVTFEALDPAAPATLSKAVLTGLLREELGFEGVIVTDDMEMNAIKDGPGVVPATLRAIEAGADLVIISHTLALQVGAWEAIVARAEGYPPFRARLKDAARRVRGLSEHIAGGPYPAPEELGEWLRGVNAAALAQAIEAQGTARLGHAPRDPDPTRAPDTADLAESPKDSPQAPA